MDKQTKYLISVLVLLGMFLCPQFVNAQKSYLNTLSVGKVVGQVNGDKVDLSFKINLSGLKMGTQDFMVLTPVVSSADGAKELKLAPIHIVGKTRSKIWKRQATFGHSRTEEEASQPYYSAVYGHDLKSEVDYHVTLAYEPWMDDAQVSIVERVTGCAECDKWANSKVLKSKMIYQPEYELGYIVPDVEPVKSRADKYSATINFKVGLAQLDQNYKNNREVLAEVNEKVAKVVHNKDLTVSDIRIVGYASPESSMDYNKDLSVRRSKTIADYLANEFAIPHGMMKVSGYGEDWKMTRSEVEASDIDDKQEILRIIDTISDPDARDSELRKLSGGATYAKLLSDIYPRIRRTEYSLSYVVRGFDVEEAKQVFRQNPKLLSLKEMFLVAQTYPVNSPEFHEVFRVAIKYFPEDPVAIVNVATTEAQSANYQRAIELLSKIKNDPRAWNGLAVSYASLRRYDEAKRYFEKIEGSGDAKVEHNMVEFRKVLEDQGLN